MALKNLSTKHKTKPNQKLHRRETQTKDPSYRIFNWCYIYQQWEPHYAQEGSCVDRPYILPAGATLFTRAYANSPYIYNHYSQILEPRHDDQSE